MFTRCYNCPFHCRHHPFFRELYMQCLIFLKRSQSIPLPLHFIPSFFFLTCYVELCVDWIFGKSSDHLVFLSRTGWEWYFSLVNTLAQIFFLEIPEDVVDVVAEVEVAAMASNCSDIIFFKRYSLTRAASFFLNTSYFFGSIYFLLSLSVFFFLRHQSLYRNHPSYLDKLYSNLCCFFFYHFQQLLVNTLLANLLTNY